MEKIMFIGNNKLDTLVAILIYVYRNKISNKNYNTELALTTVDMIRSKNPDIISVKGLVKNLIKDEKEITKSDMLDSININLNDDWDVTKKLVKLVENELSTEEMNKYISNMTSRLIEYNNIIKMQNAVVNVNYNLNTKELSKEEQLKLFQKLREDLNLLDQMGNKPKNVGMVEMATLDDNSLDILLDDVNDGSKILLATGWEELNLGLAGGLNTGELVIVQALQHKNKTGFTLSLFLQTMLNNEISIEDGKTPMWLWISLEDDIRQLYVKIFVYLYFRKFKIMPTGECLDRRYMVEFIKTEIPAITRNKLMIMRINPIEFTLERYQHIVETAEKLNNRIICTGIDYLEKAYTDGTKYNTGSVGSGLKNMFTYFRAYIQEKNILLLTPHQTSTEANNLLRGGISDKDLVKTIVGKNYTQGSRGLAQEFDIEILIHLCKENGIDYQSVQIGKFKRPDAVEAKDKYMLIPFEKASTKKKNALFGPLMEDLSATMPIIKDDDTGNNALDL